MIARARGIVEKTPPVVSKPYVDIDELLKLKVNVEVETDLMDFLDAHGFLYEMA